MFFEYSGPSACISAVSISGFGNTEFLFKGFLPVKGKDRAEAMASIHNYRGVIVIFEAPHRILTTMLELESAYKGAGNRRCVCCRELTKLHEDTYRGTISEYITHIKVN